MASTGAVRISAKNRREQILDVATRLFSRRGFEGTTTRQIAELARVNEAIIFRHFPTKEDLYWAIIERRCQTRRSKVIQEKIQAGGGDRQVFGSIAEALLCRNSEDRKITRLLLFTALERHELSQEFFGNYVVEMYETLAEYIRTRVAEGEFRDVDPLLAARGFLGMVVYHYLIQEVYGGKEYQDFDPKQVANTLTDIWLRGMVSVVKPKNGASSSAKELSNP